MFNCDVIRVAAAKENEHLQPMVSCCNFRVGFVMYKRLFSTSSCARLALATNAWLMSHKNGPLQPCGVYTGSSCNSWVAYVVHKRSLRRGTAEWLTAPKKTRWPGWPRWPLHKIAKWNAKLIELQSVQARLRGVDFRLDKCEWPPGHLATANLPKADAGQTRHGGH